jgi:hypothetical protein
VEDFSSTVTFWPADVVIVKLDLDTLSTVPNAPPGAGADRALDAPLAAAALATTTWLAVAEGDVATLTERAITADISAAAAARPFLVPASNRRAWGRRARLATGVEVDNPGEGAGGEAGTEPAPPGLVAPDGPEVVLGTVRAERVWWRFVGPKSLMMALLCSGT